VNTAIRADAQGLGFAIPIQTAQHIAQNLFAKGKFDHPYLGINMVTLTPDIVKQLKSSGELSVPITATKGILIIQVTQGSPAAQAGLAPGDVIVTVGGVKVNTATDVQEQVEFSHIGEPLSIAVQRGEKQEVIPVRPAPFPANLKE
jgi:S1-C subfamily serine protease